MTTELTHPKLLTLLQLASPALPVGAYSYSEGLETLASTGTIATGSDLLQWLSHELCWGSIRIETAIMRWSVEAAEQADESRLQYWNAWLSALRETTELRSQSWQMGRSLLRLFADLDPAAAQRLSACSQGGNWNFAIAYGLVVQAWQIPIEPAAIAFLHSWAANLISAAVRAVPLGQTEGQRILQQLTAPIQSAQAEIATLTVDELTSCSWGVALASMQHEAMYSRLFRS